MSCFHEKWKRWYIDYIQYTLDINMRVNNYTQIYLKESQTHNHCI